MNTDELQQMINNGEVIYHHTATRKGYLCVANDGAVEKYNGRFGSGFLLSRANRKSRYQSNNYYDVVYYIFSK